MESSCVPTVEASLLSGLPHRTSRAGLWANSVLQSTPMELLAVEARELLEQRAVSWPLVEPEGPPERARRVQAVARHEWQIVGLLAGLEPEAARL
jgi:hypothetical protein